MSKTILAISLFLIVAVPIGAFLGYALYNSLRSKPLNGFAWWQQNWLPMITAGIMAMVRAEKL